MAQNWQSHRSEEVMHVVLVTGGRDFIDRKFVFKSLNKIHGDTSIDLLIQGGARGLDTLAEQWAASKEVNCLRVPAKWKLYEQAAGPIRNKEMLEMMEPLLHQCTVVVFSGGRGTRSMYELAKKREGITIIDLRNQE